MAVTLPTITVTDAQGARILDAFKAKYGTTTQAETVAAYKRELVEFVRTTVLSHEASTIDRANNLTKRDQLAAIAAELPAITDI